MTSLNEREQLTGFCLTAMRYLLGDSAGDKAFLKEYEAIPFRVAPISGIREAASDVLECAIDLQHEQVQELDRTLMAHGFPSLSGMRDSRYRRLIRVLDRGHIVSDSEWREMGSLVSNLDSDAITDDEKSSLDVLLRDYETKG